MGSNKLPQLNKSTVSAATCAASVHIYPVLSRSDHGSGAALALVVDVLWWNL